MSILVITLYLFFGIILLYFGAEGLVRGSSSLALRIGITPLVVGLTVVAFGTSSPELFVSVKASIEGSPEIALGNAIGSNICNIALVLGISAMIRPIKVTAKVVKREIPIMILISVLFVFFIIDGELSRIDGVIFIIGIIAYVTFSILISRKEKDIELERQITEEIPEPSRKMSRAIIFVIVGLVMLAFGSDLFVKGAINAAERLGVNRVVIGLTVVAFGTSLPELATSLVAAFKDESDIAMGNIVGSNIFNILVILGVASLFNPISTSNLGVIDIGYMLLLTILIWLITKSGFSLNRWEGGLIFSSYIIYVVYLLIN